MLLPPNPNLTVFYWWIGPSLQVGCHRPRGRLAWKVGRTHTQGPAVSRCGGHMPISNLGALKTQAGASSLIQQTSGLYPQAESPSNSGGGPRPGGQAGRGCRVLMVGPWQVWHRPGLCPQLAAWTPAAERPAPLPPSVWSEAIQPPGRCVPPHRLGAERATPPRGRDDGWRPSPRPRTPPGPSTEEGLGAAAGRLVSMPRQPRPGSSGVLPTPPAAPFPGVWPQPRPAARPRPGPTLLCPCSPCCPWTTG